MIHSNAFSSVLLCLSLQHVLNLNYLTFLTSKNWRFLNFGGSVERLRTFMSSKLCGNKNDWRVYIDENSQLFVTYKSLLFFVSIEPHPSHGITHLCDASPNRATGTGPAMVCLHFYVVIKLAPTQPPPKEPRCFEQFLAPNRPTGTARNPPYHVVHKYRWNQERFALHFTITSVFYQNSKISQSVWAR